MGNNRQWTMSLKAKMHQQHKKPMSIVVFRSQQFIAFVQLHNWSLRPAECEIKNEVFANQVSRGDCLSFIGLDFDRYSIIIDGLGHNDTYNFRIVVRNRQWPCSSFPNYFVWIQVLGAGHVHCTD